ncbi:hypothetical protein [Helicobacter apodemus]|uniref:Uncharacterized protein n=1 Tax=Helicobacter apodemus TaxID=135569 RepID=A0A2U8FBD1_9HELI|nr:hypothetical protein [Helicobacter apodemus]AWI33519.1 hypothetical protein CDV25_01165 [Helicobacter apodemus]
MENNLITHYADYYITSGVFNIFDDQELQWRNYILAEVHNINEKSYKGFSFNMLTDRVALEVKICIMPTLVIILKFVKNIFLKKLFYYTTILDLNG